MTKLIIMIYKNKTVLNKKGVKICSKDYLKEKRKKHKIR